MRHVDASWGLQPWIVLLISVGVTVLGNRESRSLYYYYLKTVPQTLKVRVFNCHFNGKILTTTTRKESGTEMNHNEHVRIVRESRGRHASSIGVG